MTTAPTDSAITETADAVGIRSSALFGAILTPGGTSETVEWATPQEMYDRYHAEFGFTLDPCCTHENAKCVKHYTRTENGLAQDWSGDRVWMNPPYGREIGAWMKKAYEESQRGALVVCLIPARTDTAWWHDYAMKGEVRFIRRRVKFAGHKGYAPFPSAVVVFAPNDKSEAPLTGSGASMVWSVSGYQSCPNCSTGQRLPPLAGWTSSCLSQWNEEPRAIHSRDCQ